ncbi:clathrin-coated vesicle protein [Stylonychia lemnae]|uniref:Clathrin-coated vesicle protein n=1 Tax=Stylonychia lemnae TaxID=5949 RepID=A0A078B576_STYLE|nr:clathrin-coated vesicle protein [Stylonychia lemnae]|eukprot:CDW88693.1 clathrin-coated vesicle protein [Stylonychia lemnae]
MEVIEPEAHLYNTLYQRCRDIPAYQCKFCQSEFLDFGPPDLCYLVKQQKGGILSSPTLAGFFHYVYGVDASSSASVAAYIKSIIQTQETNSQILLMFSQNKHRKIKITKATFCMYDVVLRRDVRVEISIPGGTHVFAMDENQVKQQITGGDWNYVFMSSLLRSFEPRSCPSFRVIGELNTEDLYNDFFLVANNLFRLCTQKIWINLIFEKEDSRMHQLLNAKYQFELFILLVQDEDPLIVTHMSDVFLSIDKNKESILLLADKIKEYPYLVPLLLKQAQAFIKSEYFEYALKLSKICVDLCPESFEAWFQLAEVYFHMKKIKMSLIALDIAPYYADADYVQKTELINDYEFTKPKSKKTSDMHPYLMVAPQKIDYRKSGEDPGQLLNWFMKGEEPTPYIGDMTREDQEMLKKLMRVNSVQLTSCEKRCYDLLVKIEKEISWDTLLKIKSATFLDESENPIYDNPFYYAQFSGTQTKKIRSSGTSRNQRNMMDESIAEIQSQAEKFTNKRRQVEKIQNSKIDTIAEEEKSDIDDKDDSPIPAKHNGNNQASYKKQRRKSNLDLATVEDKQITFISNHSEEDKNDDQEESESDRVIEQAQEQEYRKKRLCLKIDKLIQLLFDDLNLLCEWENDEKKRGSNDKQQAGILWIHRGILAERLNRKRLAERAFRNGIEKGFSLYAWSRLLKIYADTYNPKACLVCMAEILDQAEEDGIEHYHKFPAWLEETLHDLIASNGIKTIIRLVKEMELEDCKALTDAIENAYDLKIEGFDN